MKSSFSIFELILSLIVSSVVIIYSTLFLKELFLENKTTQALEIDKINILATKVFIEKNIKDIDSINYKDESLFFENALLLNNVKEFTLNKNAFKITIFINLKDTITQTWEFSQ